MGERGEMGEPGTTGRTGVVKVLSVDVGHAVPTLMTNVDAKGSTTASSSAAHKTLMLTQGVSYKFAPIVTASSNVSVVKSACHTNVRILRT